MGTGQGRTSPAQGSQAGSPEGPSGPWELSWEGGSSRCLCGWGGQVRETLRCGDLAPIHR